MAWWVVFGMGTEGANSPQRSGPADRRLLTPREREVAELVAAGLTNRQIADPGSADMW